MRVHELELLLPAQPRDDARLPVDQGGGQEESGWGLRSGDHGAAVGERFPPRWSVADPGDEHALAQLLAPLPCIGRSDDVHAVAARRERAHQPLDECTCHVTFPARIGVRQASDVQVLTNR